MAKKKVTSIYVSPKECEECEWLKADFTCGAPEDFRCGQENQEDMEKKMREIING